MGVRRQCPALQASALGRLWADPSLHSNDRNGANRKPSLARPARLRLRGPNGARDEFHLAATAQNLRKDLLPLRELLPGRADIAVALVVIGEVAAREGA